MVPRIGLEMGVAQNLATGAMGTTAAVMRNNDAVGGSMHNTPAGMEMIRVLKQVGMM